MIIKTWRDPYDAGFTPTKPKEIELQQGLTVLVGCNGAGKTTLLMNIKEECKINKVPCHLFDNLHDGGNSSVLGSILGGYKEFETDNLSFGASLWTASEGEGIKMNISRQSSLYKEFLKTGYFRTKTNKFLLSLRDDKDNEITDNKRVLLFDATDSGMSIDSVCEIKGLFNLVLEDAKKDNKELYIIIAANEYELARGEQCFDVNDGKYLTFSDYEDYRNFILNSRKKKEKRIDKQIIWQEKQKVKEEKEYEKLKEKTLEKYQKLKEKRKKENRELRSWDIDDVRRELDDFIRHCRFLNIQKDDFKLEE